MALYDSSVSHTEQKNVRWIGHFRCDVELKVLVVVNLLVAETKQPTAANLDERLGEHRVEGWVEVLADT